MCTEHKQRLDIYGEERRAFKVMRYNKDVVLKFLKFAEEKCGVRIDINVIDTIVHSVFIICISGLASELQRCALALDKMESIQIVQIH